MKLSNTLLATVAVLAVAGPAFAQAVTLSTTTSTRQAAVTTTVATACAITGSLSPFLVGVTPNAAITLPADQAITVTCNTPNGSITVGSDDMVNSAAPTIVETASFTKQINFRGRAFDNATGYELDSRPGNGLNTATIGYNTTQRIRTLQIGVRSVVPDGNKLPVAGAYAGVICVTVDPSSTLTGTGGSDGTTNCGLSAPVLPILGIG